MVIRLLRSILPELFVEVWDEAWANHKRRIDSLEINGKF